MPFPLTSTPTALMLGHPAPGPVVRTERAHDRGEESGPAGGRHERRWNPGAYLHTTEATLTFTVELPGIAPGRLRVSAERDVLTVHGSRPPRHPRSADMGDPPRAGPEDEFVYRFGLPPGVDPSSIGAQYADGLLAVHVPNPARFRRTDIRITTVPEPSDRVGGASAPARPASLDGPRGSVGSSR